MARKSFTYSGPWKAAHQLNWFLYCAKGFHKIAQIYSYNQDLPAEARALAALIASDMERWINRIELQSHAQVRKNWGFK